VTTVPQKITTCGFIALLWVVSSLILLVPCASGQTGNVDPSMEAITAGMAQARLRNRARFRPYTVTRDYEMFGKDRQKPPKSQVTADVTFTPPGLKSYVIRDASGSGLGEKAVRRMLDSEVAIAKDFSSTDISEANYAFRFVREEDVSSHRCYVLEMLPKRNEKSLLRGYVWVDASTYLLRRVEGGLAKNPSWWVTNVRVVFLYGDAGGMWLQTQSEATATVRILGESTVISRNLHLVAGGVVVTEAADVALENSRTNAAFR
jgi:hypothetical protein